MADSQRQGEVYVALDSFSCEIAGIKYNVSKGEKVRAGHDLLRIYPGSFEAQAGQPVQYEVEDASAAPGTKRNR